jgi:hypothetical protein
MKDNYTNTAQSDYISYSLQEVSQSTGISIDSITYALKVMGLYLIKATKASGEFIFDATKFSSKMLSLTYNINEIEIKKHVMERDIGIEVIKFALKNPQIVREFNDNIQSMFTEYNDMEKQSYDYTEERQKQLSVVINKIDDKLAALDAFLKESEERLAESRDTLRIHLIEGKKFDTNNLKTKQYKAPSPLTAHQPMVDSYDSSPETVSDSVIYNEPKNENDNSPKFEAATVDAATEEPNEYGSMADSILNENALEAQTFSTPPYEVPEYVPDASEAVSASDNEEAQTESLASLNQRLIALEELKIQNDSLKSSIAEKINNYKEQNNTPELSDDDCINAMLEDDTELSNIVDELAQTELKLQELLVAAQ